MALKASGRRGRGVSPPSSAASRTKREIYGADGLGGGVSPPFPEASRPTKGFTGPKKGRG